jgi:hypothetical protein
MLICSNSNCDIADRGGRHSLYASMDFSERLALKLDAKSTWRPLMRLSRQSLPPARLLSQLSIEEHMQSKRFEPWSKDDDLRLLTMRAAGFNDREIAQALGRNAAAVALRRNLLN